MTGFIGQECPPTWKTISKLVIDVYASRVNHRKQNYMDFLTIESGETGKDINILVITDHFTCYAQAFTTPS